MQRADEEDRIGMLLDLDQGSMAVWKNDVKLGVMLAEGLSGPLCWAVELIHAAESVRLASAAAPASPTVDDLAFASAWQRRERLGLPRTAAEGECEAAEQQNQPRTTSIATRTVGARGRVVLRD